MSVRITKEPVGEPKHVVLPAQVSVRQSVKSTRTREKATFTYRLDPQHNVIFASEEEKSTSRSETVTNITQEVVHRLLFKARSGQPDVVLVLVHEEIRDESGASTTAIWGVTVS